MFHKEYSDLGAFPARGIQRRIFSELPPSITFQLIPQTGTGYGKKK